MESKFEVADAVFDDGSSAVRGVVYATEVRRTIVGITSVGCPAAPNPCLVLSDHRYLYRDADPAAVTPLRPEDIPRPKGEKGGQLAVRCLVAHVAGAFHHIALFGEVIPVPGFYSATAEDGALLHIPSYRGGVGREEACPIMPLGKGMCFALVISCLPDEMAAANSMRAYVLATGANLGVVYRPPIGNVYADGRVCAGWGGDGGFPLPTMDLGGKGCLGMVKAFLTLPGNGDLAEARASTAMAWDKGWGHPGGAPMDTISNQGVSQMAAALDREVGL